ncbi:MAG: hypothetical protein F6K32_01585 [Desertifilum sp. SIO1I2]|nr:hypothetical protein [Desertifilum sp. SIO1I2]
MLVFFIHGVATRDIKYADPLKESIKQEFTLKNRPLPHFYSSFWGNALSDVSKMWNCLHQDFQDIKTNYPQSHPDDVFRYRQYREGFLSEFMGDFFTYLNPERGLAIRKTIAQQLLDFIHEFPQETELHIVAHSLGTVILWDMLFANRWNSDDPAFLVRSLFQQQARLKLQSITTMASPIVFINTLLGIPLKEIQAFISSSIQGSLSWLNLLHSSDIIAYPLKNTLAPCFSKKFSCQDIYLLGDANLAEKTARSLGQMEAAMALGLVDAHQSYLTDRQTARLISNHLLAEDSLVYQVINRLYKIRGMTPDRKQPDRAEQVSLKLKDGSGTVYWSVNHFQVYQVAVLDSQDNCHFSGYVGWLDGALFKEEMNFIKTHFSH